MAPFRSHHKRLPWYGLWKAMASSVYRFFPSLAYFTVVRRSLPLENRKWRWIHSIECNSHESMSLRDFIFLSNAARIGTRQNFPFVRVHLKTYRSTSLAVKLSWIEFTFMRRNGAHQIKCRPSSGACAVCVPLCICASQTGCRIVFTFKEAFASPLPSS